MDGVSSAAISPVRILIIDDHAMFREGVAELLSKVPDFVVVGRCSTSAEALGTLQGTGPTVILLDFDLGAESAFDFLGKAVPQGFLGVVLIVTAGVSEAEAVRLVQAGVAGILHKQNTPEVLCDTIRKVAAGEVCMEKNYLKSLFRTVDQTRPSSMSKLTEKDKGILRMVFQGLGNREIGGKLDLSEGAVKAALRQLFQKLGARTRAQMVKVALEEYRDQL
ncbi:MAG: response regulator transcription factor [Candidatus Solibacter sp.]